MSVASTSTSVSYTSNGVQTAYAVPFYFFAFSDLVVMVTAAGVTTTSPITTGWLGSGTPDTYGAYPNGGTVTFQPGQVPVNGATISIIRVTSRVQPDDFPDGSPLSGIVITHALDRLTLMAQEGGSGSAALGGGFLGLAPGIPTSGNYIQGQFYINSNQQPGQPFGWMCTQTGAPGIWVAIASLSA